MRRLRIGALVVSDDGRTILGILSEHDIVFGLAESGAAALETAVADVMTSEVITCERKTTVDHLMAMMTERRIRHVPVVEDGGLAGIISIGDVVKSRLRELVTETEQLSDYITHGRWPGEAAGGFCGQFVVVTRQSCPQNVIVSSTPRRVVRLRWGGRRLRPRSPHGPRRWVGATW